MTSPLELEPAALKPQCVAIPGTFSGFHPRRMPLLRVACPASEGAPQRYRQPLWRAFKAGTP